MGASGVCGDIQTSKACRAQLFGVGLDCASHIDVEGSRPASQRDPGDTGEPRAREWPEEGRRQRSAPKQRGSPEPSDREPKWSGSERNGPSKPSRTGRSGTDSSRLGNGVVGTAAPPARPLHSTLTKKKPEALSRLLPRPSPPSPATNTTKTAPLRLADAMAAGMAPWNHSIAPRRPRRSLGVSPRSQLAPPSSFSGLAAPATTRWPGPSSEDPAPRRRQPDSGLLGVAHGSARGRKARPLRLMTSHVAWGCSRRCLVA